MESSERRASVLIESYALMSRLARGPLLVALQFQLGNGLAMDFIGTVGEAQRARVSPGFGQAEIVADTGAAVSLNGAVDDAKRHVGSDDFDHGDLGAGGFVAGLVHHVGCFQCQQARLVDLDARVGDVGADRALLADRPSKSYART